MRRTSRAVFAITLAAMVGVALAVVAPASAHGGVTDPPSRTYTCRFLSPSSAPCAAAWASEPQALYDWMEVNIGDVNGQHIQRIPDGKLCSAGRDKYAAFDAARSDWPATAARPGPTTVVYEATAPHATAYFRYYLTTSGYDPNQPLKWSDLTQIYDSGPLAAATGYRFDMTYPQRTGRHVLYVVWQRSDSPEAFYSCSDLDFGGGSPSTTTAATSSVSSTTVPGTSPSTTTGPSTTAVSTTVPTTAAPSTTAVGGPTSAELPVSLRTTSDWGGGFCAEGTVRNSGAGPVVWSAMLDLDGRVTSQWNAAIHAHGSELHVEGEVWNSVLASGASTTFGFCAERISTTTSTTTTTTPPTTVTSTTVRPSTTTTTMPSTGSTAVAVTRTSTWATGYCADVSVTNRSTRSLIWTASVPAAGRITSLWNAIGSGDGTTLRASGAPWNRSISAGGRADFGYCVRT